MSLGHHGNIGTAYGLEAVIPETERTTATTAAFNDEELQLPTVPFTLAPNVGPPHSVPVDRRNTGYVSLDQPAMSRLATPEEFHRSTRSQASPVSGRFSGDSYDPLGKMRAFKNVTFRGVRGRGIRIIRHPLMPLTMIFPMSQTVTPVATLVAGLTAGPSPASKPCPLEVPGTAWPVCAALVVGLEPRLPGWRGRDRPLGETPRLWTRLTLIIIKIGRNYQKKWTRT